MFILPFPEPCIVPSSSQKKAPEVVLEHDTVGMHATFGPPELLLSSVRDNLIAHTLYANRGYSVLQFETHGGKTGVECLAELRRITTLVLRKAMAASGVKSPNTFQLEDYHKFVTDQQHEAIYSKVLPALSVSSRSLFFLAPFLYYELSRFALG